MREIAVCLIVTFITSCRGEDSFVLTRLKTADKFMECLANNTPDEILQYTYPNIDHKINDKESREFYVSKACKFIKSFGMPPKEKWIIKYDPQNNFERLLITIPIFKGYDSTFNLLEAEIVIAFPPPEISDKIVRYEIDDRYDVTRMKPILAPEPIDTTKSQQ